MTLVVTIVLTVVMLWLINQPLPALDESDKVVHLFPFAALVFLLALTKRIGLIPIFVYVSALDGIIEVLQTSFGRSADIQD